MLCDLVQFATWFAQTNGEPFAPGGITLLDVRGYKCARCTRVARNGISLLWGLLSNTGLRVGELAQLTLGDIELSLRKGLVTVRSGKRVKYRQVPLNVDARRALEEYLPVRPSGEGECLFIGQRGGGLTPPAIWRVVKRYGKHAGLAISPHTLRHTFGTRLARSKDVDL
jgi:site-specific recombinase XerD